MPRTVVHSKIREEEGRHKISTDTHNARITRNCRAIVGQLVIENVHSLSSPRSKSKRKKKNRPPRKTVKPIDQIENLLLVP